MALYNIDEFRDDIRWTFGENSVQMEVFNGMRELTLQQAQIIAAKNAEIAQMRGDYAGALEADAELTGDVLAAGQGA